MEPALLGRMLDVGSANLWQACWQGGLVVLAVWLIVRLMPSTPVRCQAWLWRLAMLKFAVVLLLPALVDLPLLPAPAASATAFRPSQPQAVAYVLATTSDHVEVSLPKAVEWPSLRTILGFAWILGVGWSFVRLSMAWRDAKQLCRQGRIIEHGPMVEQLRIQASLFGLRRLPKLVAVDGDGSPMLLGVFRPVIAIPTSTLARLSVAEQTMMLGHELAHIRRGDLSWGFGASLVRAVFFFHPLVWLSQRQLKLAQEVAADELAIARQHHDPIGYGNLLVSVVGKLGSQLVARPLVSTLTLETAGPVHSLTRRLVAMTRIGRTSRRIVITSSFLLASLVLLGLVPWRLVAAQPKEGEKQAYACSRESLDSAVQQARNATRNDGLFGLNGAVLPAAPAGKPSSNSPHYSIECNVVDEFRDRPAQHVQAPKVTVAEGQTATVIDKSSTPFVIAVKHTGDGDKPNIQVLDEGFFIAVRVLADKEPGRVTLDARIERAAIGAVPVKNQRQCPRVDGTVTRVIESVALGETLVVKTKMPAGKDAVQSVEFVVRQVDANVAEGPAAVTSERFSDASGIGTGAPTKPLPQTAQVPSESFKVTVGAGPSQMTLNGKNISIRADGDVVLTSSPDDKNPLTVRASSMTFSSKGVEARGLRKVSASAIQMPNIASPVTTSSGHKPSAGERKVVD